MQNGYLLERSRKLNMFQQNSRRAKMRPHFLAYDSPVTDCKSKQLDDKYAIAAERLADTLEWVRKFPQIHSRARDHIQPGI
eukprot:5636763-Pleurochrysis_carterae.AAC.1